jgi:hypothetical protein
MVRNARLGNWVDTFKLAQKLRHGSALVGSAICHPVLMASKASTADAQVPCFDSAKACKQSLCVETHQANVVRCG